MSKIFEQDILRLPGSLLGTLDFTLHNEMQQLILPMAHDVARVL